jgi:hypothetical protein
VEHSFPKNILKLQSTTETDTRPYSVPASPARIFLSDHRTPESESIFRFLKLGFGKSDYEGCCFAGLREAAGAG